MWRSRGISWAAALACGVLVEIFAPAWLRGRERFVAVWVAAVFVLQASIWLFAMENDPVATRQRAAVTDPGKNAILAIVLAASMMGLISAFGLLGRDTARRSHPEIIVLFAILAIALSWTLIHTTMTLRYAHLYYQGGAGGLTFPGTREPCDYDFAYFAFVIGMTFQTSDVAITSHSIRQLVLFHALISFGYSVAIIAVAVNVATALLH